MTIERQYVLPHEEEEYFRTWFQKIEILFAALRGRSLLLSPADYHLALEWYRKGIPLSCVLRGIREAFYRRMAEGDMEDEILSLRWCSWAVMKEWKVYKMTAVAEEDAPAAAGTPASPGEKAAVLEGLDIDLRAAIGESRKREWHDLADRLEEIAAELEKLAGGRNEAEAADDELDAALTGLDERMMAAVLDAYPAGERAALEKSIARKLKTLAASMSAEARETSRSAALVSRLRLELRLPRLTLYGV
jgi:hypothetical protein